MADGSSEAGSIPSALFVDFDNVFIGLEKLDSGAAKRFASDPARWFRWIEEGMPGPDSSEAADQRKRRVLIRRCYLNPNSFYMYRTYFTRTGFSVVDCPPLTLQDKTSTDIHMVIDVLDAVQDYRHIAEYILFSGDADFSPLLRRLRALDRLTIALTVGPASSAFRASADRVLTENDFIEVVLGSPQPGHESAEFALIAPGVVEEPQGDAKPPSGDAGELRAEMLAEVRRVVEGSDEPVALERVANELRSRFGNRVKETGWAGAGGFKALLLSEGGLGLQVTVGTPGYIYDPARHEPPPTADFDWIAGFGPEVGELITHVHHVTGAPALTSAAYGAVFRALSDQLHESPYRFTATSRAVRDRCTDAGEKIARQSINVVLKGIAYRQGFEASSPKDAVTLARVFADNVLSLAAAGQLGLSDEERAKVISWLTDGVEPSPG